MDIQKTSFSNIVELLQYRAIHQSQKTAFIFLQDGEVESETITYKKLDEYAKIIATYLEQSEVRPGDRVLLIYPSGIEFIKAFFGCLYSGVIAVPVDLPKRNHHGERIRAISIDAKTQFALTTSSTLKKITNTIEKDSFWSTLYYLETDNIEQERLSLHKSSQINTDNIAFLQYTSGSTGEPKGVIVTHLNILHNLQALQKAFEHDTDTIIVGWLPLFNDMGLILNVLQPIYLGIPCILMPPVAFLQKPIRWLKAISKYRATTSGEPNFAYDICIEKIKTEQLANLDLSSWDLAFNGAGPLQARTLEQFSKKIARCGFNYNAFYPCYGMAETTLLTTGGNKNQKPVIQGIQPEKLKQHLVVESKELSTESLKFVGCGYPYLDTKVIIVHPESLNHCKKSQVEEIWISGGSITSGYWNNPKATQETFQAHVADIGEGPFLRTGDLGFLLDGELFVTGRIKDVIIIRGRNYYSQDIELTVEKSHQALRNYFSAAFSREIEGEQRLFVACEVKRTYLNKLNTREIAKAIQIAVSTEHELEVYGIVLLKTGSIPKTSSGKDSTACL